MFLVEFSLGLVWLVWPGVWPELAQIFLDRSDPSGPGGQCCVCWSILAAVWQTND